MAKRDKLTTKTGQEIDCNIVGFIDGINGKKIIIYTTADKERELLASYYNLDEKQFLLEEITSDEEWSYLEKEFNRIEKKLKNNKK